MGKDFKKIIISFPMFLSDDYHQGVDKTECTDSDDSEEVVTQKLNSHCIHPCNGRELYEEAIALLVLYCLTTYHHTN